MAEIEIEIDGKKLKAAPNQTVIQVADDAGIYIPRFCYHKHLSIPANCRMCLVEVEKAPKPMPACATPVAPGMKVFTKSQKAMLAQRAVMEFLLVNHPLDCPICDQGGECELQDLSMGYGSPWSDYFEPKRAVADQDLGPLIATEMTRCIYCTRCVRFGDEVAGMRELGAIGRGEFTEISTYIQHSIKSEVSGNIIDLCPVGALTSKPFRFTARAWELDQAPSISPHDCIGSNIFVHSRYGKVMRVAPRENMTVNSTWIADRDRYSYTALYHPDRIKEPLARIDGVLQPVDWEKAFTIAASALKKTLMKHGGDELGALASPSSTTEEFYLLQKIMRSLNSSNIDHRLREMDVSDQAEMPLFPGLGMPIAELENCDGIFLIGSHIQKEQPIAAIQIRKAALKGASVVAINPVAYRFSFPLKTQHIVSPQDIITSLTALVKALKTSNTSAKGPESRNDNMQAFAQHLRDKQRLIIVLGAIAMHHPHASHIRYLAQSIAQLTQARLSWLTEGANSAGGWLAGAIPHRSCGGKASSNAGLSAYEMMKAPRKAYVLFNVEPEFDFADAMSAIKALSQADVVIAISLYKNTIIEDHADVILPLSPFTETSGTFINAAGSWQHFGGTATPYAAARPGWKILRAFANFLECPGFEYESSDEVRRELAKIIDTITSPLEAKFEEPPAQLKRVKPKLSRIGEIPIYAVDGIVRRSKPLQIAQNRMQGNAAVVRVHPQTAKQLGVKTGDSVRVKQATGEAVLPLMTDERIAIDAAAVAGGIGATSSLGELFGEIEIEAV